MESRYHAEKKSTSDVVSGSIGSSGCTSVIISYMYDDLSFRVPWRAGNDGVAYLSKLKETMSELKDGYDEFLGNHVDTIDMELRESRVIEDARRSERIIMENIHKGEYKSALKNILFCTDAYKLNGRWHVLELNSYIARIPYIPQTKKILERLTREEKRLRSMLSDDIKLETRKV